MHSLIFVRLSNDAMSATVSSMSITTRSSPGLRDDSIADPAEILKRELDIGAVARWGRS